VKVRIGILTARAGVGAALVVALAATLLFSAPPQAHAITRAKVLERARVWVKKKVSYSQYRHYKGYRRDCSGFVSMAWKLGRSYSSRTIASRARRIPIKALQPGDAVLVPGHVSLFAGWKDKKARTYWALEQTTWGDHAKKRARKVTPAAKALRYKKLTAPPETAMNAPSGPSPAAASMPYGTSRLVLSPAA